MFTIFHKCFPKQKMLHQPLKQRGIEANIQQKIKNLPYHKQRSLYCEDQVEIQELGFQLARYIDL